MVLFTGYHIPLKTTAVITGYISAEARSLTLNLGLQDMGHLYDVAGQVKMWPLSAFRSILHRAIEDIDILIQPAIPLMGSSVDPEDMSKASSLRKGSYDPAPPLDRTSSSNVDLGPPLSRSSSSKVDLGVEITNAIKKSDKDKYHEIIRKMIKFKDIIELELFMKMRSYRLGRGTAVLMKDIPLEVLNSGYNLPYDPDTGYIRTSMKRGAMVRLDGCSSLGGLYNDLGAESNEVDLVEEIGERGASQRETVEEGVGKRGKMGEAVEITDRGASQRETIEVEVGKRVKIGEADIQTEHIEEGGVK
eukprot:CAMPEP_0119054496 /NCGR_PEP_ID=MMETSP1177-20130426/75105_1 /TAXON_ID=2985 /ORGANISM="Ochromonas sp, Strain CCMP1899" /LENGTH=303 /DNA_ID=CAMNT_0007034741 /DNA_START=1263 /DNA_END=2171 /DNA_ORIENTATION=-